MSIQEYRESMHLAAEGSSYGLLMAAMRNADTQNLEALKVGFPEKWEELKARYNAPGGALNQVELDWVTRLWEDQNSDNGEDNDRSDEPD